MRLWKRTVDEDLNDLGHRSEEFAALLADVQAHDAHRRDQVASMATLIQDLQATCRSLQEQVDHLHRTVPGKCGWCGKVTDSPDVFHCNETCRQSWNELRTSQGKVA